MIKELAKSIREYKRASIATPILVSMEVVMECTIPFIIAQLVNQIKAGCGVGHHCEIRPDFDLDGGAVFDVWHTGRGAPALRRLAGWPKTCGMICFTAFKSYSFENIDKFLTSSLVTRMTTDITNVQNAYMMIIRTAIRAPLMLVFAFVMAFVMGGKMAWIFLIVVPILGTRAGCW